MHGIEHHGHEGGEHRHRRHHDEDRGHHGRMEHHGDGERGRHGFGGRRGHGRRDFRSGRKLSSADVHLILLALLAERPSHGYELMKALDEHSHGLYSPSPGMIYPALTYLEEVGYASIESDGSKKRYSLTESGRAHYEENRETASRLLSEMERIGAEVAKAREEYEKRSQPTTESGSGNDELDGARYELRRAIGEREPLAAEDVHRIAAILLRAAEEIRQPR